MSDYLYERIWHDSGDSGETNYRGYDSSSSASVQNKTVEEEAQIGKHFSSFSRTVTLTDVVSCFSTIVDTNLSTMIK